MLADPIERLLQIGQGRLAGSVGQVVGVGVLGLEFFDQRLQFELLLLVERLDRFGPILLGLGLDHPTFGQFPRGGNRFLARRKPGRCSRNPSPTAQHSSASRSLPSSSSCLAWPKMAAASGGRYGSVFTPNIRAFLNHFSASGISRHTRASSPAATQSAALVSSITRAQKPFQRTGSQG